METKLDNVDSKILSLLQKDSKLSYRKIAGKLGISKPHVKCGGKTRKYAF